MSSPSERAAVHPEHPSVVLAVVIRGTDVLLLRRQGAWMFPGGKCHPAELPARAVVRELYEETGLLAADPLFLTQRIHPRTGVPVLYWLCPAVGAASLQEPEKHQAVQWHPIPQVPILLPDLMPLIRELLLSHAAP